MNQVKQGILSLVVLSTLVLPWAGEVAAAPIECESVGPITKVVVEPNVKQAAIDFVQSGGDLVPLLKTRVIVGGVAPSCLVAHFNSMANPTDNFIVYQLRVDGVPMEGHTTGLQGLATPVVYDPEETNLNLPRMVAHSFFKRVNPGVHTVEVRFASCCSPTAGAGSGYTAASVLVLQHQ